jgi:hypothetical protein
MLLAVQTRFDLVHKYTMMSIRSAPRESNVSNVWLFTFLGITFDLLKNSSDHITLLASVDDIILREGKPKAMENFYC